MVTGWEHVEPVVLARLRLLGGPAVNPLAGQLLDTLARTGGADPAGDELPTMAAAARLLPPAGDRSCTLPAEAVASAPVAAALAWAAHERSPAGSPGVARRYRRALAGGLLAGFDAMGGAGYDAAAGAARGGRGEGPPPPAAGATLDGPPDDGAAGVLRSGNGDGLGGPGDPVGEAPAPERPGGPADARLRIVSSVARAVATTVALLDGRSTGDGERAGALAAGLAADLLAAGHRPPRVDVALAAGCGVRAAGRPGRGAAGGRPAPTADDAADAALLAELLGRFPAPGRCPHSVGPLLAFARALALLGDDHGEPARVDVGVCPATVAHHRAAVAAAGVDGSASSCDLRIHLATALLEVAGTAHGHGTRHDHGTTHHGTTHHGTTHHGTTHHGTTHHGTTHHGAHQHGTHHRDGVHHLVRRVFLYEHGACAAALPYQAGAVVTIRSRGGRRVTVRVPPGGGTVAGALVGTAGAGDAGPTTAGNDPALAAAAAAEPAVARLLACLAGTGEARLTG